MTFWTISPVKVHSAGASQQACASMAHRRALQAFRDDSGRYPKAPLLDSRRPVTPCEGILRQMRSFMLMSIAALTAAHCIALSATLERSRFCDCA